MLDEQVVHLVEPGAEELEILERLVHDELGCDVFPAPVCRAREHDQLLGLLFRADRENRQMTLRHTPTGMYDDGSADLDGVERHPLADAVASHGFSRKMCSMCDQTT